VAASLEVNLREITSENLDAVLALKVREEQRHLVASNAKSIAQAHFAEAAWFRAIYAGETPVGFVMLALDDEGPADFLWRLMVDASYQGRGYARLAMERIIEDARSRPNTRSLVLCHQPVEGNAGPFYEALGFKYTGEKLDGELLMKLDL
jgi:diamine N-acetyltransferase